MRILGAIIMAICIIGISLFGQFTDAEPAMLPVIIFVLAYPLVSVINKSIKRKRDEEISMMNTFTSIDSQIEYFCNFVQMIGGLDCDVGLNK